MEERGKGRAGREEKKEGRRERERERGREGGLEGGEKMARREEGGGRGGRKPELELRRNALLCKSHCLPKCRNLKKSFFDLIIKCE